MRKTPLMVALQAIIVFSMTNLPGNAVPLPMISDPATRIINLKVQAADTPLAVEDKNPVFSWQMISETIGQRQSAFQIIVKRKEDKSITWNSGKVESGLSVDIRYGGSSLEPETEYSWELTVWDKKGKSLTQSSWFETGLMNPAIEAWDGAKWIGTNKLTLDAASASLFEIRTDFRISPGSSAVSLILGANDFRFNDGFQNIENVKGENYIRFELDISGVGKQKGACLNIYRVGYVKNDSPDIPYKVISAEKYPDTNINKIITEANKNSIHNLSIAVDASNITIQIDSQTLQTNAPATPGGLPAGAPPTGGGPPRGSRGASITITNYGSGGNFNTFPNLNSIGFASRPGDEVILTNYRINNKGQSSTDNNVVFDANTGCTYSLFERIPGVTLGMGGNEITVKNITEKTIAGYADPSFGSLTMLRTMFSTGSGKRVAKAKMYVTSMGANEVFINGNRMGDDWFGPGDSQFRETICYYAYDVTGMIKNGSNCIGAILSPGWYTGYMTFTSGNFNFFGDTEALLAKLVITYSDGTKDIIVSNPDSWKLYKNGPVEYGSFFQGERFNAKKEPNISVNGNNKGWSTVAYEDSKWAKPEIVKQRDWIKSGIVARYDQAVRVAEILQAEKVMDVHSTDNHTYTYNMGLNMVGVPSVTIPSGWLKEGDVVIMRYGEQLYPGFPGDEQEYIDLYGNNGKGKNIAGRILTESYRGALATDFYTASNSNEVVIQPSTTYRGYQFIQITIPNHTGPLPLENVRGLVLSSDKLPAGTYKAETTDNTTGKYVNQLFKNIQRSQLGNFFTIPTDCPQRNERMGWTGDAQAYTRTATYNSDARNFFRQWMVALRNDQGAGSATEAAGGIGSTVPTYNRADGTNFPDGTTWAAAVCMVPWQLYIQYGDKQIIEENLEAMMAWLNGMDFYNFSDKYTNLSSKTSGLSDWLAVDNNTPAQLVNNAIYIYMMEVTAVMAEATGKTEYAAILRKRHALAKTEWNEVYVDPVSGKTRNANGALVHTQTSYATPLNFNAFSDGNIKKAQDYLAELAANPSASNRGDKTYPGYSITTGFSGTPNILPALSRGGYVKEAYNMFTCTDYASWLYPVIKGSTSIWERWNGYELAFRKGGENSMNSFNHFALGAVGQWMYEFQLGITNDHVSGEAGYKHFIFQPAAGEKYTSLKGSFNSNYGAITSSWTADGKGTLTSFSASVPANTTATLYLPVTEAMSEFRGTKGVKFIRKTIHNNIVVAEYEMLSGRFNFAVTSRGVNVITL